MVDSCTQFRQVLGYVLLNDVHVRGFFDPQSTIDSWSPFRPIISISASPWTGSCATVPGRCRLETGLYQTRSARLGHNHVGLDLKMEYLLDFMSTAMSLALVAIGLVLVQRSHGIAVLETIPVATGWALFFLSSLRPTSASTLDTSTLILPSIACAVLLAILQPLYAKWRLRVAGEPTALLLSFASMNCCLLAMSIATSNRSISLGLADSYLIKTKFRLEWAVIALAAVALAGTMLYVRQRCLMAALQLSKDDHRLLATFGRDSNQVKRHIFIVAILACIAGMLLFASLQETFSVSNSYAVLIPSFAVAISQSRIRVGRLVATALLLVGAERLLTQHTSELLLDVNRAVLFSLFVLVGITSRRAYQTGITSHWRRSLSNLARRYCAVRA